MQCEPGHGSGLPRSIALPTKSHSSPFECCAPEISGWVEPIHVPSVNR